MKTPACGEEITKEWLEEILSQYECRTQPETSVKVTSFEINEGVSHGENFSSQLVKIMVKARVVIGGSSDDSETTYNLLSKFLQGNAFQREASKIAKGPLKEILIYSDVIPALNSFQAEVGDGGYTVNIPGYVHSAYKEGEFILVMEDLRPSGYRNNDKRKGLSLNQILLAIEKLAVLHGVSFAYNERHNFLKKFPDFTARDEMPDQMTLFISVMFDLLLSALAETECRELAEKLKKSKSALKRHFSSLFRVENHQMKCLCHGDYWNNNFMFKAETEDKLSNPDSIMLVDWGNPQWYSPILDVQYVIHTSTTLDLRKSHEEEILQHYHSTFTKVTTDLGAPAPFWTFEAFKGEYQRFGIYGALMGTVVNAITLGSAGEKFTKEQRDAVSRVDSSSTSWKIGSRLGKLMAPVFFTSGMRPLMKAVIKKWCAPFFEEVSTGENKILNQRIFDLLNEANSKGLLD